MTLALIGVDSMQGKLAVCVAWMLAGPLCLVQSAQVSTDNGKPNPSDLAVRSEEVARNVVTRGWGDSAKSPFAVWPEVFTFLIDAQAAPRNSALLKDDPNKDLPVPIGVPYRLVMIGMKYEELGRQYWKIRFLAQGAMGKKLAEPTDLYVPKKKLWPSILYQAGKISFLHVENNQDVAIVTSAPAGFPVEFFPFVDAQESEARGPFTTVRMKQEARNDDISIEATLQHNSGAEVRVLQKWVKGEFWWREYERHVNGELDLKATRQLPSVLTEEQKANAAKFLPAKPLPQELIALQRDLKLHVKVTVVKVDPKFDEIVSLLQQKTAYSFSLAPNLTGHDPKLGSVKFKEAPVWSMMSLLSRCDLENGKWTKTPDGYRLEGTSRALRPSPPSPFPWGWTLTALAGAAVTASGGFVLYRRRAKPAAPTQNAG